MIEVNEIMAEDDGGFVFDPLGFFYIYLDAAKGDIVVEHYENVSKTDGEGVETGRLRNIVRGKNARTISKTIARLGIVSRTDHAMYLGRELQKAQEALEGKASYEQDGA